MHLLLYTSDNPQFHHINSFVALFFSQTEKKNTEEKKADATNKSQQKNRKRKNHCHVCGCFLFYSFLPLHFYLCLFLSLWPVPSLAYSFCVLCMNALNDNECIAHINHVERCILQHVNGMKCLGTMLSGGSAS